MRDSGPFGTYLVDSSDARLRRSRESSSRSQDSVLRSRDLVRRSRELLAQTDALPQPPPQQPPEQPPRVATEVAPIRGRVAGDVLQVVSGEIIQGQLVNLDGTHFIDCEILDCTLQYSGLPVMIESTRFSGCRFQFSDEAALTVRLLECFDILPAGGIERTTISPSPAHRRPN